MRTRREDRSDYDDRPYSFFDDDNEDRGWFDRVRDSASRWWHGPGADDRMADDRRTWHEEEEHRRRFMHDEADRLREARRRDDERRYREQRMFERERLDRFGARRERFRDDRRPFDDDRARFEADHRRSYDDRDRFYADRDRDREEEDYRDRDADYRVQQFASYGRDSDDRSPQFNRQHDRHGELGRRGDSRPYDRGPRPPDHADERDRRSLSRRDADWHDRYPPDRQRYPVGNAYDQRLAYDRERERFERHRADRYRAGERDHVDLEDDGYHRPRRFDPFEHDDIRRAISRFRDRDRRR